MKTIYGKQNPKLTSYSMVKAKSISSQRNKSTLATFIQIVLKGQKTKIMASGPITSWQIDGETVETVADYFLSASKITADGDCSHEIKSLLLGIFR